MAQNIREIFILKNILQNVPKKVCQILSKKVLLFRELRRLNFGVKDHKRKAFWTIECLKDEEKEQLKKKAKVDAESQEIIKSLQNKQQEQERINKKRHEESKRIINEEDNKIIQKLVDDSVDVIFRDYYYRIPSKPNECMALLRLFVRNRNQYNTIPRSIRWYIALIRIVFVGFLLCFAFNHFGKEFSSCNAGDGPPKSNSSDRNRPRSISFPPALNCSLPSILGRNGRSASSPPVLLEGVRFLLIYQFK